MDLSLRGLNVWHSLQYLAFVWFLMAIRKERGEIAFGVSQQQACYIVILSTLLQHYLDHLQFTKLGDMLGGDRLPAGRS